MVSWGGGECALDVDSESDVSGPEYLSEFPSGEGGSEDRGKGESSRFSSPVKSLSGVLYLSLYAVGM